jgi:hypothetical protein
MDRFILRKIIRNKDGVALVLVLMIVVISAGLLAAVMYYALTGTEISGLQRKYQTSKEASLGAIDIFTKELVPRVIAEQGTAGLSAIVAGLTSAPGIVNSVVANSTNDACFQAKLSLPSTCWSTCLPGCGTGCGSCAASPNATTTNANENADITFNLLSVAGGRPFEVNLKIIDTVDGNSSTSPVNLGGSAGVVPAMQATKEITHHPFLYTMVTEGKLQGGDNEAARANFEVLYAY